MSKAEDMLALHLKAEKIEFTREHKAIPGREFRFDFAFPTGFEGPNIAWSIRNILVEVQGGIWMKGKSAHSSGIGLSRDCEKASLAAIYGYRLIQVTPAQIKSGKAIDWIKRALAIK